MTFLFVWGQREGFHNPENSGPTQTHGSSFVFTDDKSSHPKRLQLLQEDHKPKQVEQPAGEASETTYTLTPLVSAPTANVKRHGFTFRAQSFMRGGGKAFRGDVHCCLLSG